MPRIVITPSLSIDDTLIGESFIAASGPGGQNVNKVATAVHLRFLLSADKALPEDLKIRLRQLAGQRLTLDGDIVLRAQKYRTRERNRQDALERLIAMIKQAAQRPAKRRRTKPSRASRERRIASKVKRGRIKALRRNDPDD